ncbi:hypothetical protein [Epilithonimonas lactis]|uniref:Right handed beta helix region n=1 Tax=Epilithonimonas lactis TaxID=421072 RepID=A0A085BNA9_9FLAO|nr:hypothetical protein [Epilithonimonas lactis]KFC23954.1 hypothetical protein IO89_05205 [Epilithonimonas lactis]SEQ31609.1 hypothetical protein SAMN04488097_2018 [Epilithonimonas lactis]
MKIKIFLGIAFWSLLLLAGCNRDDISFESPTQLLRFSTDTVFCDTVYNQMRSETYAVKVFNNEDKDVLIPRIALEGGSGSLYRINVDGKVGTSFENVALRRKDSLYVFVEIAPIANAPEAIAEDKVVFNTPAGEQKVTLFSVVQDAEYFIKSDSNPNIISENTTWTKDKVKVIFGDLTVAEGKTLTMEKGTKVYFRKNSGMNFAKNSILDVKGALGDEVIFRGDRSDTKYDTLPANWNGIKMDEATVLNMNYARLFGGNVGLQLKNNTATINNTIIHTFQNAGIYGIASNITANNLVMNNCGEADFAIAGGGTYTLNYSTLANYWNLNPSMNATGIYASNVYQNGDELFSGNTILRVNNSIVYGDSPEMISLTEIANGGTINARFDNSLLKLSASSSFNPIGDNIIKNEDPKFQNYYTQKMNLRVKADSPAKGKGINTTGITASDIVGNPRGAQPTIGAYQ